MKETVPLPDLACTKLSYSTFQKPNVLFKYVFFVTEIDKDSSSGRLPVTDNS